MQEFMRWTDQFPTVSALLSMSAESPGEIWNGSIPLNAFFFDERPGARAFVGFTLAANLINPPIGVRLALMSSARFADYSNNYTYPRRLVQATMEVQIHLSPNTPSFEDLILRFVVSPIATDAPSNDTIILPAPVSNIGHPWTVRDVQGGEIPSFWSLAS